MNTHTHPYIYIYIYIYTLVEPDLSSQEVESLTKFKILDKVDLHYIYIYIYIYIYNSKAC